jgi:hypothetical protein
VDLKALLRELARPRMTGTEGAHEVAEIARSRLNALGFQVHDFPFIFSTLPGRFAVTAAGVIMLLGTGLATWLLIQGHPGVALVLLLVVLLLCGALAALTPLLTHMLPFGKVTGVNLLAKKPDSRPRYIVMAHLDSKSQPLPLAFRGPAIVIALVGWAALAMLSVLGLLDPVYLANRIITPVGVAALIASVLLVFCWVENRSPGALDNASGLATLIGVAERAADMDDVAYLITDAEELGLVGARTMAARLDPVIGVINVDGIDDHGTFYILEKFGIPPRYIAPHLVAATLTAAAEMDVPARRRNVPFGLLLDHLPLARKRLPAITVMRGSMKSMRRVHRPADSTDSMSGHGIESAVRLIRRALEILRSTPAAPNL